MHETPVEPQVPAWILRPMATVDAPCWRPPREFDDLILIRQLGPGGMGAVHLAREVQLDRLVAVKFVAARLATSTWAIADGTIETR